MIDDDPDPDRSRFYAGDPGDESDHKQCEEKVINYGEEERCRYPKGHKGPHGLWYYQPEAKW